MNTKELSTMIGEEYMKQMKLRNKPVTPEEVLLRTLIHTMPVREDGSIAGILCWESEKIVEIYHKGPLTIIIGFYPRKEKGESK